MGWSYIWSMGGDGVELNLEGVGDGVEIYLESGWSYIWRVGWDRVEIHMESGLGWGGVTSRGWVEMGWNRVTTSRVWVLWTRRCF